MKKKFLLISVLLGISLVISACAQSSEVETNEEHEDGAFRVEVSRNGFNNEAQGFHIEVEEDQEVELTFVYGDSDFSQNNPHNIIIPEYGIETGIIDENNPEVTVHFTATGHGEIAFMCAIPECIGHSNLVSGRIVIEESGH
ncbi:MAG: hypothetical protein V3R96_00615 [Dehalococcoidales bacterium]